MNIHNWISEILGDDSGLMIFVWTNPGWELPQRLRGWGFSSTTWYLCGASAVLLWPWQGPSLSRRTGRDLGVCDRCVTTGWVNIHNYQLFEGLFGLWKAGYCGEINWCNPKFEQFNNVAIEACCKLDPWSSAWGFEATVIIELLGNLKAIFGLVHPCFMQVRDLRQMG